MDVGDIMKYEAVEPLTKDLMDDKQVVDDKQESFHGVALNMPYYCQLPNGNYHIADIIQGRQNPENKDIIEYYVHFKGFNRRLDEWVTIDRINVDKKVTENEIALTNADTSENPDNRMTRNQKRMHDEINNVEMSYADMDPTTAAMEKAHEELTKVKYISKVRLGKHEIGTWYFSPYPDDYGKQSQLYICEYCLNYMKFKGTYKWHKQNCDLRQPPGIEVYRKGPHSVYEVDGKKQKIYCQNLCLLAKLFLDHKTLYFDVAPFLFYIMTEVDQEGAHIVGYFSKEKQSPENNNLACILVLPPYQRKGYGIFLISFSYELSRRSDVIGSPEKPLSDLGRLTYRSYWTFVLLNLLRTVRMDLSVRELSELSYISKADIKATMGSFSGILKYWKGLSVVQNNPKTLEDALSSHRFKMPKLMVDPAYVKWEPAEKPPHKKKEAFNK